MQRIPTLYLRATLIVIGATALSVLLLALPSLWVDIDNEFPGYSYAVYAVFITIYLAAIPFFATLVKAWVLLGLLSHKKATSPASEGTLTSIALFMAIISGLFMVCFPFFYIWGELDDAPGLILIGMILAGSPLVIAACALVLRRFIRENR